MKVSVATMALGSTCLTMIRPSPRPSGSAVANFTVASSSRVLDKATNEWKDGDTVFLRCNVWRQYAENVAESLTRGMRVIVTGRLKVRQYETRDGGKGTSVECEVDDVGHSGRSPLPPPAGPLAVPREHERHVARLRRHGIEHWIQKPFDLRAMVVLLQSAACPPPSA